MAAEAMTPALRPAALFIGHPGHELRVYGWSRSVRPKVFILTDGSGTDAASRLDRTTQLLSRIGAVAGRIYARFSDREIYEAIMDGPVSRFTEMADEIAQEWIEDGTEIVASDANEGYCPTHDLCCEMAKAATELVFQQSGRRIDRYTFRLTVSTSAAEEALSKNALRIRLDDEVLDEKIAAAKSYLELRHEVDQALALKGADYFRNELLLPGGDWNREDADYKPFYEERGERRVAQRTFTSVLRYREHVLPIFNALREHATSLSASMAAPHAIA
jgi:hypothetical protein